MNVGRYNEVIMGLQTFDLVVMPSAFTHYGSKVPRSIRMSARISLQNWDISPWYS